MTKSRRIAWIAAVAAVAGVLHPSTLTAQVAIKGGVIHGEVSASGAVPEDLGARTGVALGLAFTSKPGLLGLGAEALYAQRGTSPAVGRAHDLDYVDIPVYLRVMVPSPGVAPYAYAGPQVSIEVRCRLGEAECPEADRSTTTYAGIIGAGVRLGAAGSISIEGRYVYGLDDLDLSTVTDADSYEHRSFMILAAVSF